MAKLKLNSTLVPPAGFWGVNRPVKNATVKIIDLDAPGRHNDIIWQGTTDANGAFQGESSDWKDTITLTPAIPGTPISPGIPAITGPDPTDILMLQIVVSQATANGNKQATLPFAYLGDNLPTPPVTVTWAPSEPAVKVNGVTCNTPDETLQRVRTSAQQQDAKITIDVYGPDAVALGPLALPLTQLRQWIQQQRPLASGFVDPPSWAVGTAVILMAVAVLCLAIGATAVLFAIGIAIILAVAMGYRNIEVEQRTDAQTGENYIHFELER